MSRLSKFACLAIAFTVVFSNQSFSQDLINNGPWVVSGFDIEDWTGSDLVFTSQTANGMDFDLEGYFDWRSNGIYRGRELFTGTLFADRMIHLEGYELVDPLDLGLYIYDAEFAPNDLRIIDGVWEAQFGQTTGAWAATLLGDVNCDGFLDLLDVAPFVNLITSGSSDPKADINKDNTVDLLDVQPFIDLLTS